MLKILFVCTGNTCRSPMAQALYRAMGGEAESAGLYASEGMPASRGACLAMAARGLDLSGHTARSVSQDMLARADLAVGMTQRHAMWLRERFPRYADKIVAMPREIPDPFGGDEDDYLRCAEDLSDAIGELCARKEDKPWK